MTGEGQCPCEHCGANITFPLDQNNTSTTCPHCQQTTLLRTVIRTPPAPAANRRQSPRMSARRWLTIASTVGIWIIALAQIGQLRHSTQPMPPPAWNYCALQWRPPQYDWDSRKRDGYVLCGDTALLKALTNGIYLGDLATLLEHVSAEHWEYQCRESDTYIFKRRSDDPRNGQFWTVRSIEPLHERP